MRSLLAGRTLATVRPARGVVGDLVGTAGVTAATAVAALAVVGVLVRVLPQDEFFAYSLLTRYLSLVIVLVSLGVGFAFIGATRDCADDAPRAASLLLGVLRASLALAFLPWLAVSLWLVTGDGVWPPWTVVGFIWICAHAGFALSGPVARARDGVDGYVRLALGSRTVPLLLGAALAAATGDVMAHLIGFGITSLAWQMYCWHEAPAARLDRTARASVAPMLRFGATRWLDDLLRMTLPVALVGSANLLLGSQVAAGVAVVYLVAKSLESLLQPLVIALMMRVRLQSVLGRDMALGLGLAVMTTLGIWLARPVLESLFELYLGTAYSNLIGAAWLMLLSAGPIIAVSFLRACHDNRFDTSPLFLINIGCLFALAGSVVFCRNVDDVALAAVVVHVARFAAYMITLAALQRNARR